MLVLWMFIGSKDKDWNIHIIGIQNGIKREVILSAILFWAAIVAVILKNIATLVSILLAKLFQIKYMPRKLPSLTMTVRTFKTLPRK